MATTNIELDIENITGVSDADDKFVISAQKFVVASVPKNLLKFAQKASSASTDGSAITFSVNDSILDVQRNGYSCKEIPMSDAIWALDSTSLKYATAKHPVWYHKQGAVHFAPVTDGSNAGYVFYIDYSKIDDDCDLRNAVIFHAASSEFSKLASSKVASWSSISTPIAPILSDSSITFNSVVPIFTKPTRSASTVFNDYWTLGDFGDSDPDELNITAVPPTIPTIPSFTTPDIASTTISNAGVPPVYTAPNVTGDGTEMTSVSILDADNTIDTHADQSEFDQWWSTATHLIEGEEDIELAGATLQKISTYINAYTQAMQNKLNQFNEANVQYQAELQKGIQQAQISANEAQQEANLKLQKENQEYVVKMQRYNGELSTYQADVNKQVQEYVQNMARYNLELNTVYQSWVKSESDKIEIYKSDIQNESAVFNRNNAQYQAELQVAIQEAQLISQDDAQKLQKYSNDIQEYQNKINEEVQKLTASNKDSMFYANESKKYYEWSQLEINSYIKNNSKMIGLSMQANQQSQQQG